MLRRLSSLFRSAGPAPPGAVPSVFLEDGLEDAAPDYRATMFARAAERFAATGQHDLAQSYFGRAVDAYLEFGYYDVAAALCRRMIELYPQVVRARCTLAFLSLGRDLPHLPFHDLLEDARREIGAYVRAAEAAGVQALAVERLALMVGVTDDSRLRALIGECALELGGTDPSHPLLVAAAVRRKIGRHVLAARREGREAALVAQLRTSAGPDTPPEVREVVADVLGELGDTAEATEVRATFGAPDAVRPGSSVEEQRERWIRALRTTIVSSRCG
jgi:hypothetical protein